MGNNGYTDQEDNGLDIDLENEDFECWPHFKPDFKYNADEREDATKISIYIHDLEYRESGENTTAIEADIELAEHIEDVR